MEIEKISKEFGIWQTKNAGVCSALSRHPRTKATAGEVDELFNQLKLNELIQKNLKKTVEVRTFKEDLRSLFAKQL
jgi:hypothetical protein